MVRKVYDYLFNQNHPLAWSAVVIISFGLVMTINFYWINAQDEQTTFIIASTGILLYSIYCAVMMLLAKSLVQAWNHTLFGIIITAIGLTLIGMLITSRNWSEIDYYTKILKVIVFVS
ncbi:MAG: hypothetical protein IPF67_12635 [Saprospiraceae bacterium]|nr:hypothetical protein [Candidatus Brachybacter algidus]